MTAHIVQYEDDTYMVYSTLGGHALDDAPSSFFRFVVHAFSVRLSSRACISAATLIASCMRAGISIHNTSCVCVRRLYMFCTNMHIVHTEACCCGRHMRCIYIYIYEMYIYIYIYVYMYIYIYISYILYTLIVFFWNTSI
jgi:hypothetical protein